MRANLKLKLRVMNKKNEDENKGEVYDEDEGEDENVKEGDNED